MPTVIRCDPKLFEKDLSGQVMIVTGANSGCGLETSRQLAKQGATVVLACRNASKGEVSVQDIGTNAVFLTTLDLSSLENIKSFVAAFLEQYNRLDALVNNAGIMMCPYGKTKDGFEMQFGCNHLGHFLLMRQLTPLLLETAKKNNKPSRFVALSSCASAQTTRRTVEHPFIDFEDPNWETREYNESMAYAQSKLANYLHAVGASMEHSSDQLIAAAVHPGWVLSPLDQHIMKKIFGEGTISDFVAGLVRKLYLWKGKLITPQDGAQTTLHCLLDDNIKSGKFYLQFGIYKDDASKPGGWPMKHPNPNATKENTKKLWDLSNKLVGM